MIRKSIYLTLILLLSCRVSFSQQSACMTDLALIKSYIPLHPNGLNTYFTCGILSDSTFFIRANSFDGFKEWIEKGIKDHWKDIMGRPNLVLDLRNNGGGQDDEWQMLFSLLYTTPYFNEGVEWYACEDNIKGYEGDQNTAGALDYSNSVPWLKSPVNIRDFKGKLEIISNDFLLAKDNSLDAGKIEITEALSVLLR